MPKPKSPTSVDLVDLRLAPLPIPEAVTALLDSLDLDPETTAEVQINLKARRVRVFGTDRSLRTRSYT